MPRSSRFHRALVSAAAVAIALSACGERSGKTLADPVFPPPDTTVLPTSLPPETAAPLPLTLVAPWVDGTPVPDRHTCTDLGVSPALTWANIPAGTVELALSVVDLDAASSVHWLVYAISVDATGVAENAVPGGSFVWPNSSGTADWSPLCPPAGTTHRYEFTVYALNQQLEVADDAPATEVVSILNATSIARSSISGISSG